ncbi:MAG TPA: ABC transporter permease [Actinomycetales bacterium]|nr:ABC transporter permease [Actinomycetales bacterium]
MSVEIDDRIENHSTRSSGDSSVPERKSWASRNRGAYVAILRVAALVTLVALWELAARIGLVNEFYVSRPLSVAEFLATYIQSDTFWTDAYRTISETLAGFALGGFLGVAGGLVLGRFPLLEMVSRPFVAAIQSLPKVALAPMFILWFGLGSTSKIYLGTVVVFFIVLIATESGVRSIEEDFMTATRALGASGRQLYLKVVLPGSVPAIFAGLRLGAVYSLLSAIVGEMIAARDGWGLRITYYSQTFDAAGVFGILIVIGVFASGLAALMKFCERRLLWWQS